MFGLMFASLKFSKWFKTQKVLFAVFTFMYN
jgi:hypothetical protein